MGNPAVAVYYIRSPAQFLHSLEHPASIENRSLSVVLEESALIVGIQLLASEIILVVDKVHLKPCRGDGCHFDYKGTVHIIYYEIHSREPYHFVQLVFAFIDAPIARHERAYFFFLVLNALRQVSGNICHRSFREVRKHLGIHEQYIFDRISHVIKHFIRLANKGNNSFSNIDNWGYL